jgi:hypothetical protein
MIVRQQDNHLANNNMVGATTGTKNSYFGLALTHPKLNECELATMGILHSNSLALTTALR